MSSVECRECQVSSVECRGQHVCVKKNHFGNISSQSFFDHILQLLCHSSMDLQDLRGNFMITISSVYLYLTKYNSGSLQEIIINQTSQMYQMAVLRFKAWSILSRILAVI